MYELNLCICGSGARAVVFLSGKYYCYQCYILSASSEQQDDGIDDIDYE